MKKSAGILLFRIIDRRPEVFLVHPGGPFWAKKDTGSWSIPKGEFGEDENPQDAARREMEEETGIKTEGPFIELTPVRQRSGKIIYTWALQQDADPQSITSNFFEMEWPPKSGLSQSFPEIDRAAWFELPQAKKMLVPGQVAILDELETKLHALLGKGKIL